MLTSLFIHLYFWRVNLHKRRRAPPGPPTSRCTCQLQQIWDTRKQPPWSLHLDRVSRLPVNQPWSTRSCRGDIDIQPFISTSSPQHSLSRTAANYDWWENVQYGAETETLFFFFYSKAMVLNIFGLWQLITGCINMLLGWGNHCFKGTQFMRHAKNWVILVWIWTPMKKTVIDRLIIYVELVGRSINCAN